MEEIKFRTFNNGILKFEGEKVMQFTNESVTYNVYKTYDDCVVTINGAVPPQAYRCNNFTELAEALSYLPQKIVNEVLTDIEDKVMLKGSEDFLTRRPVAAIDFDGTIVKNEFPEIGKPLPSSFRVLKKLQDAGWILVLWTCRDDEYLEEAVEFCRERGLEFTSINENPPQVTFDCSNKVVADVYVDDKNPYKHGDIDWEELEGILLEMYDKS